MSIFFFIAGFFMLGVAVFHPQKSDGYTLYYLSAVIVAFILFVGGAIMQRLAEVLRAIKRKG